jgi:hypothetical protein
MEEGKKSIGNPMWIAGGKSPNPEGGRLRNRHSARTVRGMVERFIKKNITPNKLQVMFSSLKEQQRLEMLMQLLPYILAKPQAATLTESEIETLYQKLEQTVTNANQKKIG